MNIAETNDSIQLEPERQLDIELDKLITDASCSPLSNCKLKFPVLTLLESLTISTGKD